MKWSIGDVRVTMVRENTVAMPLEVMYPEGDRAQLADHADWVDRWIEPDGTLSMSVHSLVLESQGKTILVDTCNGTREVLGYPDLSNQPSALLDDLVSAGFPLADIDVVLCTHLHLDHVGCNTVLVDGKWVPTFPNARYYFSEIEYKHWAAGAEGAAWTFQDAVRPVFDAGAADLVPMDHVVTDEVRLEPTPGHSPGHVSVHITSQGSEAVITGDVLHHPVQFAAPHWRMFLDGDPEAAGATRASFIERYADSGVRVFGTHFPHESTGFLESVGDSGVVRFV